MDLVFVSFDYAAKDWNELCGASIGTNSAAQHCSSLCSQSEGDEDYSEPIADFAAKHFNVLCGEAL